MKKRLSEKDIAMHKTSWTYDAGLACLHLCSTDNITRPSKVHDSLNYHEPGLTNYSFDASAGIITIDWKLNTSDDIDSSDNDVTQHADNGMTGNRRVQKKTRTTDLTRST